MMLNDIRPPLIKRIKPVMDRVSERMTFKKSVKYEYAFEGTQASNIPKVKIELKRNKEVMYSFHKIRGIKTINRYYMQLPKGKPTKVRLDHDS